MARAKRHHISGHIWRITHRCHKREFLLKSSQRSSPVSPVALGGEEALWPGDIELHGDFESCAPLQLAFNQ